MARQEFLIAIGNPKAILIFTAFFPQFIDSAHYLASFAVLGAIFLVLEFAAIDDPTAANAQRLQAASLRAYLADLAAAEFVDLADASTVAGVQALEAAGLLAKGRAAKVIAP